MKRPKTPRFIQRPVALVAKTPALRANVAATLPDGLDLWIVGSAPAQPSAPSKAPLIVLVEHNWPEGLAIAQDLSPTVEMISVDSGNPWLDLPPPAAASGPFASTPVAVSQDGPSAAEQGFVTQLDREISARLRDNGLSVAMLARVLGLSPRQLLRRTSKVTGQTVNRRIRARRLEAGRELLERGAFDTVAEVAAQVGLSPSYFTRAFGEEFGRQPSAVLRNKADRPRTQVSRDQGPHD